MTFTVYGSGGGIAAAARAAMAAAGHEELPLGQPVDCIIWAQGKDWEGCVSDLLRHCGLASRYIVVTSEHGSIPIGESWVGYAGAKAAQKMVVQALAAQGVYAVDISPAFVMDSGGPNKKIHKDALYRQQIIDECRGEWPVLSADVARAIVFAAENASKITGSVIRVSAGWRLGGSHGNS
jgi:NAD(P)-dependent dehydrogenase (short-subunit alcohol dehydrogenase family)